ncbi:hypothetical protein OZL92_17835 [Bacillus sonorensis]|uniref:hypothetical protein n=1 Tax=Bacillus TaxID=1386 RepID=UPI00058E8609|nr:MULTISPECIES: hypothetical protein [Bacillus]NWN79888.1 hypothetical protein [Bacillus sp. (in: firmicutes)]MBG9915117.1 hypothetical protein [Bacillus sonorensis]MCZ0070584.1 hypothetical protein [Bacillus sonorensis]MCZ0093198.1 hypothetical protein [Bacillus sonorensis]MCZ0097972.1 hypothetical protein [Bacillus sonorensis]
MLSSIELMQSGKSPIKLSMVYEENEFGADLKMLTLLVDYENKIARFFLTTIGNGCKTATEDIIIKLGLLVIIPLLRLLLRTGSRVWSDEVTVTILLVKNGNKMKCSIRSSVKMRKGTGVKVLAGDKGY